MDVTEQVEGVEAWVGEGLITIMCGFNKMGPPHTLPEPQWLLFEPCSLIASFHGLMMFPGHLDHPTFQCANFFFLWGYFKSRVYEGKSRTLEELKGAIRKQIRMINQELLEKVRENFRERLQICILQNGHHLSDNFSYINSLKWHLITYHFVIINKFYTKN